MKLNPLIDELIKLRDANPDADLEVVFFDQKASSMADVKQRIVSVELLKFERTDPVRAWVKQVCLKPN